MKSLIETKTILQCERQGLVINARRPTLKDVRGNLDFKISGPHNYTYVDVKNPIHPKEFPPARGKPESFYTMGRRMGEKIIQQKDGSDQILHIVDLEEIPLDEKEGLMEAIFEGAGTARHILYIN